MPPGGAIVDAQALVLNSGQYAAVAYLQACPEEEATDCTTTGGWDNGDLWGPADRDLRFVDAVIADIRAHNNIDMMRIYAAGFSRGAFFTYYLACRRDGLRRIVAAAGALNGQLTCPTAAEPVLHIHDPFDPYICWATLTTLCLTQTDQVETAEVGYQRWQGWAPTSQLMLVPGAGHIFSRTWLPQIWAFFNAP